IGATRGQVVQVGKKTFPLASWTGLLHHGVTFCEQWVKAELPRGWAKAVRAEINVGDCGSLIGAGTKIEEKLKAPEGLYITWLQSTVGALKIVDGSVLAAIAELGLPIATTNYDRLIEAITSQPAVNWTQRHKVQPILRGDAKGIIHLHGDWDDPKSIVLGHRTYAAVERDPHAQAVLREIFSSRTVLLVGFGGGLSDPNFGPLLKWVAEAFASSTYPHFLLCLEKDLRSLKLAHPIQPLDYGKTHADLAPFLRSLAPSGKSPPPDPSPQGTNGPRLLINFPRNPGFLGREDELTRLHAALSGSGSGSGPVGIRPAGSARAAGLIGMGGIGKTQLAVEYSYRQHEAGTYPDGIFWINAGESLDQGFARLARDLGVAKTDQALDQQVRSALDALGRWKQALLVLDNLEDPGILNRHIVSGCIPAGLSCRLLFTTRRRDLGGFTPVEVTVLPEGSAIQLLLRHPNRQPAIKPGDPDHEPAVAIARMLGRLPLALELAGAYLGKWSDPDKPGFVSLAGYRERLRTKGRLATVDVGAERLSENELQSIHEDAVEATLRQQWDALDDEDARRLLLVAGQLPEAAVIPNERLGLLAGVAVRSDDGEGPSSLDEALRRLEDDCLVEELRRDQMRLHPLVREFAERLTPAATRDAFRLACAGRMAAAYEDYATLEEMARKHPGVTPLEGDLLTALDFCPADDKSVQPPLQSLLRVLQR
ncbi:MAG TPA: SIR2 family protein, partial [Isosphaeraceae bacterium]|nr:SIR2 family protein [Isosphaeraceae bacterium]